MLEKTIEIKIWKKMSSNCNQISEYLYISGLETAVDKDYLKKNHFKRVITVMREEIDKKKKSKQIEYIFITAEDNKSFKIILEFKNVIKIIKESNKKKMKTLIHCRKGKSRSATLVIAYLMSTNSIDYETAFNRLKKIRPTIDPNTGFIEQLEIFERLNYKINCNSKVLRRYLSFPEFSNENSVITYFKSIESIESQTDIKKDYGKKILCKNCLSFICHDIHIIRTDTIIKGCEDMYSEPFPNLKTYMLKKISENFGKTDFNFHCNKCNSILVTHQKNFRAFICKCNSHRSHGKMTFKFNTQNIIKNDGKSDKNAENTTLNQ